MADELDDGLLLEDELVAYSDDASDAEVRPQHHAPPPSTDDAAAAKKRKRREQAKAQRRKVRWSTDPRKQPGCRSRLRPHSTLRSSRAICRPTSSLVYSARRSRS